MIVSDISALSYCHLVMNLSNLVAYADNGQDRHIKIYGLIRIIRLTGAVYQMTKSLVSWKDCGDYWYVCIDNPPVKQPTAVRAGLSGAEACDGTDKKAVILTCAGRSFIAGGDITEFDAPPQEHIYRYHQMIEQTVPWVAVLHGHVLGGGLEIQ